MNTRMLKGNHQKLCRRYVIDDFHRELVSGAESSVKTNHGLSKRTLSSSEKQEANVTLSTRGSNFLLRAYFDRTAAIVGQCWLKHVEMLFSLVKAWSLFQVKRLRFRWGFYKVREFHCYRKNVSRKNEQNIFSYMFIDPRKIQWLGIQLCQLMCCIIFLKHVLQKLKSTLSVPETISIRLYKLRR